MAYDELTKRQVVGQIVNAGNLIEKISLFALHAKGLGDCSIFLFDEDCSNFSEDFANKKIGICEVRGLSDYTKTWVLNQSLLQETAVVRAGKTIDFDLNVLTYLDGLLRERQMNIDREEFCRYLNYLKENGFQCGIVSALLERVSTPVDLQRLAWMIQSFVRFDGLDRVDADAPRAYLPPRSYEWAEEIYRQAEHQIQNTNPDVRQYDLLYCLVLKAFVLKNSPGAMSAQEKTEELIRYSLDTLNCYLENELVLLSLYLKEDDRTKRAFKKLRPCPDLLKKAANVTWDIFHLRILEQIMEADNSNDTKMFKLAYFGTADRGIVDVLEVNPLKAFAIIDGRMLPVYSRNIAEICTNSALLEKASAGAAERKRCLNKLNLVSLRREMERQAMQLL